MRPTWITDSIRSGKLLPWTDYRLLDGMGLKVDAQLPIVRGPVGGFLDRPDFVEDFFQKSRLHHLSTWKNELRAKSKAQLLKTETTSVNVPAGKTIFHVDMDCFFASVGLRDRPELANKPVAVSHSKGTKEGATSDIASCNYVARGFGVRNGMLYV